MTMNPEAIELDTLDVRMVAIRKIGSAAYRNYTLTAASARYSAVLTTTHDLSGSVELTADELRELSALVDRIRARVAACLNLPDATPPD